MTLHLTTRITEKMEGRTSLESHEVEVLKCLQNIHSRANGKKAPNQIKITKEFLDIVTPAIKEKKKLAKHEERLLGQLAVVAFCQTNDADFIALPNFLNAEKIQVACMPHQYKKGYELNNKHLFGLRMETVQSI